MENSLQRPEDNQEEMGIFQLFAKRDGLYRYYVQTVHLVYISHSSCLQLSPVEETGSQNVVLVSAHLLQVGRQQKRRRQKLVLFVHHFSLTCPFVVCACRDEVHILADGMKQQSFKTASEVGGVN